ncbi:DTW domain-containing protein [Vibrio sp. SM6]|uniref:tRNA-uridine aminocarboxypropyltransferase n=1 Tax=Vibrio agarilyticus TaxID=2726741 RepID=A0A7X8TPX4_9VIBR|nr:tRNA-uridine aminocarboxypropyltransferase [Vibrio agarilyticus]NLS12651.1 DTW domain-containing protein [Vibrio agarilyticus]
MRQHAFHHLYQQRKANSTKPFNARGSKVSRCSYCQVATDFCLCGDQPNINTNVAVMLIVSDNEVMKPSNTGRLIADVVKETYVYQWNRTDPDADMLNWLNHPDYYPVVVFPDSYTDDKTRLITEVRGKECEHRKPLLIFIDGSWREARRIFRRSPWLSELPVLSIAPQALSQYMMRHSDNEQHLSTAEVASIVLDQVQEVQAAQTLQLWFEVFRESYLLSKTRLKPDLTRPCLQTYRDAVLP